MAELDLSRGGRPAGRLLIDDAEAARAANLLRGGGFQVEGEAEGLLAPAAPIVEDAEAGEFVRIEDCVPEKPRPCEVATAIGYARDLAADNAFDAPKVSALIEQGGYRTEMEVQEALAEAVTNAPAGDARLEAAFVLGRTFGMDALPGELSAEDRADVEELIALSAAQE